MRHPFAPIVLALVLTACGGDKAPELVAKAKTALQAQDTKAAQIHLKNALQQEPDLAEARYLLGRSLLEDRDAQGALVELDKAGALGYSVEQLAPLQAQALLQQRQSRKLLERFGSTQLQDPKAQAVLLTTVAQARARLGQLKEALASLEAALQRDPQATAPALERIRLQAGEGQMDGAIGALDTLLAQHPKLAEGWRLRGDLQAWRQRDMAAARTAYERAVALDPKSVEAQLALVAVRLAQRELDPARQQLELARKAVGNVPGLGYFSALIDMEQGRLDNAAAQVEQLLKGGADDARVLLLAGQVEFLRERYLQAESHLVKAVAQPGDVVRGRLLLAQTYLRLADPTRALQALQPLLEEAGQEPQWARVHALAGDVYLQLGESRRAEEQFKRAAQLDPKDARSRTLLALGKLEDGGDPRGLAELRDLADNQDNPMADMALVGALTRKGDYAAAMKAIDGIARKLPANKGLPATLRAQVLRAQGKNAEGLAALESALRDDPKYLPAALQLAREDLRARQGERAVARLASVVKADPSALLAQLALLNVRQEAGEPLGPLIESAQALVKQHPKEVRLRAQLLRLQLRAGELAAAGQALQDAMAQLPNEAELVELQADLQLRQREPVLAAKTLDRLAELRPAAAEPLLRKAELEMREGKTREALASVRKALAVRAEHPAALRLQVLLEAELGNVSAARRLVKELQQRRALEAFGWAVEGDLEAGQRQWDVAESAYRRALSRNAALPELPARLHRVLSLGGKNEAAQTLARDWFKDHPRDFPFMNYLGDRALNSGDLASARDWYERSLALLATQPAVLNNLAWIALRQGQIAQAEARLGDALRLSPADAPLHDTQAQVLAAAGKHDAAQAAQRRAMALDSNPIFRVGLARRLLDAGRKDAARDELLAVQRLGGAYKGQAEVSELLSKLGA